jgi:hypothetical protein
MAALFSYHGSMEHEGKQEEEKGLVNMGGGLIEQAYFRTFVQFSQGKKREKDRGVMIFLPEVLSTIETNQ